MSFILTQVLSQVTTSLPQLDSTTFNVPSTILYPLGTLGFPLLGTCCCGAERLLGSLHLVGYLWCYIVFICDVTSSSGMASSLSVVTNMIDNGHLVCIESSLQELTPISRLAIEHELNIVVVQIKKRTVMFCALIDASLYKGHNGEYQLNTAIREQCD